MACDFNVQARTQTLESTLRNLKSLCANSGQVADSFVRNPNILLDFGQRVNGTYANDAAVEADQR